MKSKASNNKVIYNCVDDENMNFSEKSRVTLNGDDGPPLEVFIKRYCSERVIEALRTVKRLVLGNLTLLSSYMYDYRRYRKWSSATTGANTESKLQAHIVKDYHRLEKGLALAAPRPGFGGPVIRRLLRNCEHYHFHYGLAHQLYDALGAMQEYCDFQDVHGIDTREIRNQLGALETKLEWSNENLSSGTTTITLAEILKATHGTSEAFFQTRHSVRQFTDVPLDRLLIEEGLRRAQRTPSVCNRQCSRVYVLTAPETKARALSFQNGNRGFGHQAGAVFIVTAELASFTDPGERFQGWIDGGMYSMSLVYALHSLGLGTCTLNWSVTPSVDRGMRAAMKIPDNELVIMMIAAGHIPEDLKVASSPRPPIEDTTRFIQ